MSEEMAQRAALRLYREAAKRQPQDVDREAPKCHPHDVKMEQRVAKLEQHNYALRKMIEKMMDMHGDVWTWMTVQMRLMSVLENPDAESKAHDNLVTIMRSQSENMNDLGHQYDELERFLNLESGNNSEKQ